MKRMIRESSNIEIIARRTWTAALFMIALAVSYCLVFAIALIVNISKLPDAYQIRSTILDRYPLQPKFHWIPLYEISPRLQQSVIAWEDPNFYHHGSFNTREIVRALRIDLINMAYVRGASTITQQVAKNMYLYPTKSLRRKVLEIIMAGRIERALSKKEIIEIYLNMAEWGPGIEGAEYASEYYFGKPASDLDWSESALMAGILQNPIRYDPYLHRKIARKKQLQVLAKLYDYKIITHDQYYLSLHKGMELKK